MRCGTTCARLGVPVLIHTGEPAPFFDPVDERNERWLELQVQPERRRPPASDFPTFEALMAERDRLFRRNTGRRCSSRRTSGSTRTTSGASGGCSTAAAERNTETGAILEELARQPRAARAFFVKYQDRICSGRTSAAWRVTRLPVACL